MKTLTNLSAKRARAVLDYDPNSGLLTWKVQKGSTALKGQPAGYERNDGYLTVRVDYTNYLATRVIWLWMTGKWPKGLVDHIDRNPRNNKWNNLRDVSRSVNTKNQKVHYDSLSGTKCIRLKPNGRFYVEVDRKSYGGHATLAAAISARDSVLSENHGRGQLNA